MLICVSALLAHSLRAQTAVSLFARADSVQTGEIFSASGNEFGTVGHHGPAVENSHFALRIYFNDSGSIDIYSKSGRGMELRRYLWYPDETHKSKFGAGGDEYVVGNTLGAGGIALWDDGEIVRLVATEGRRAKAGKTKSGSFIELVSYGVEYKGSKVDICIRADMSDKNRNAIITASELSGKKVQFVTGVNFFEGEQTDIGKNYVAVWGKHPYSPVYSVSAPVSSTEDAVVSNVNAANAANADDAPVKVSAVGAALKFREDKFLPAEKTDDFLMLVSKPTSRISTTLIAASEKEAELRTASTFFAFIRK